MFKRKQLLRAGLLLSSGLLFGGAAQAAIQWDFTGGSSSGVPSVGCTNPTDGNKTTYGNCGEWSPNSPATTPNVQGSAWANTGSGGVIQDAYLAVWSGGLGVINRTEGGATSGTPSSTSPNHSLDNNGQYDSILLRFDQAITLTGVRVGWPDGAYDSDITVMAYTGADPGNNTFLVDSTLAGKTYAQLGTVASGWSVIGSYANADLAPNSTDPAQPISTTTSSRFWLIGAYNPLVVTNANSVACTACVAGNDYVKILSVIGDTTRRVPEPSSAWLLFAVVGAGGWAARRKLVPTPAL